MTRFAKGVAWLEPFYNEAIDLLPKKKQLTEVKGYSSMEGTDHVLGCTHHFEGELQYLITVKAWHIKSNGKRSAYLAYYMLEVFAHELAHIKYDDHDAEHMVLMCKIMRRFAAYAKKKDYNLEVKTCKRMGKLY